MGQIRFTLLKIGDFKVGPHLAKGLFLGKVKGEPSTTVRHQQSRSYAYEAANVKSDFSGNSPCGEPCWYGLRRESKPSLLFPTLIISH